MLSLARVSCGVLGLGLAGLIVLAADRAVGNGGPAHLPFAQGESFDSLDAYLAHRERLGTIDIPWYRLLPDGTYEVIRRRPPGTPPQIVTRAELLLRYGFAR